MNFSNFATQVYKNIEGFNGLPTFTVAVTNEDLWETYLSSFPTGSNPIYRTKTEHDCNCCKSFIRTLGNVVAIKDGKVLTIWDVSLDGEDEAYQIVADAMKSLVLSAPITSFFLHNEGTVGQDKTYRTDEDGDVVVHNHFFAALPANMISRSVGTNIGIQNNYYSMLKRAVNELDKGAFEVVLDLISQGSLYRGDEFKLAVKNFLNTLNVIGDSPSEVTLREKAFKLDNLTTFRNSVIGTLIVDLSDGVDLEKAVRSYESKVAPTNYKRPTKLITKGMTEAAEKKATELGIVGAFSRRYARTNDLTINNVIFADRSAKVEMGVFDSLKKDVSYNPKKFSNIEEVSIDKFVNDILPNVNSIELLLENKHTNNLVSLIAPVDPEAGNILKWDNNFSWSYNGEVTDSIKERVKKAGGDVDGYLRASLSWSNHDDLDIHMILPNGKEIYYGDKRVDGGNLDVDMNATGCNLSDSAVENITFKDERYVKDGVYKVFVRNFNQRVSNNAGYEVEIECNGTKHNFVSKSSPKNSEKQLVATFEMKNGEMILKDSIPSTQAPKEVWGVTTTQFQKVTMLMNSPNHWDDQKTGNKHWFFMLEGCANPESTRGFYNEFLRNELDPHRKVFEVLASKMKVPYDEHQLSGIGFSSTKRDEVICKVTGTFTRTLKIKF